MTRDKVIAFCKPEETMTMAKNTSTNESAAVAAGVEQPKLDYTQKIKAQLLAVIGKPPRLDHLEVSRHDNGKYRVNIWRQPDEKRITVNDAHTDGENERNVSPFQEASYD